MTRVTPPGLRMAKQRRSRQRMRSLPRSPACTDPEIPVNIYELGLIYAIEIADSGAVKVEMTLTAPACPSAQELPEQVHNSVMTVPGVASCDVETVWDPPWDPSRMTEEARLQLNMF